MADNFIAEQISSAGEIFATDQDSGSSVHYPIGKIAWGALNTFNVTDSSSPFPVRLYGNNSAAPAHVTTDSGSPPAFSLSGNASVINSSGAALYVRGLTDSHLPVTGDSGAPLFVRGMSDSTVPVSGSSAATIGAALNAISGNSAGALQTFSTVLSSAIETVTSSAARLYGYMITNPDTAAIVYVKVFADDSAGVTKGTTSAALNLGIPPLGGANVTFPQGALMSSGISVLAAGGSGLTDTSAPSTSLVLNLFYRG